MPVVAAVVTTIASTVATVVSAIVSLIATVITTIATVVATVVSTIGSFIFTVASTVASYIFKGLSSVFVAVKSIAFKVYSGIVSVFTSVIKTIMPLFRSLFHTIKVVVGTIGGFIKSVIGAVSPFFSSIISTIRNIVQAIVTPIKTVIGKIREVYSAIKSSIIGKIIGTVKEVVDFLSTIHTIAQAYDAFQKEKYLKALYIIAMKFDEDLAREIKETKIYIETNIASVLRDINTMFTTFRRDITSVYQYSVYLEQILQNIADYLGVEVIEKLADGLEQFRLKFLSRAKELIDDARTETMGWITTQLHPVYLAIRELNIAERDYKHFQRIFNFLSLKHLSYGMYSYQPSRYLSVPRVKVEPKETVPQIFRLPVKGKP